MYFGVMCLGSIFWIFDHSSSDSIIALHRCFIWSFCAHFAIFCSSNEKKIPSPLDSTPGNQSIFSLVYNLENFESATAGYENIVLFDPYHYESFYYLGKINIIIEKYDAAIPKLTQALMLNPDNADIYYNLGIAYISLMETIFEVILR